MNCKLIIRYIPPYFFNIWVLLALFSPICKINCQLKVMTLEQFYSEIEKSNKVYKLTNTIIKQNNFQSDEDLDFREKEIELENVQFGDSISFLRINFGSLYLKNCSPLSFFDCSFNGNFTLISDSIYSSQSLGRLAINKSFPKYSRSTESMDLKYETWMFFACSFINYIPKIRLFGHQNQPQTNFLFSNCSTNTEGFNNSTEDFDWYFNNLKSIKINDNKFTFNKGLTNIVELESNDNFSLKIDKSKSFVFTGNQIENGLSIFDFNEIGETDFDFNNTKPLIYDYSLA